MFSIVISSEEITALYCPHGRGGPPIVFLFIYVVHRNFTAESSGLSLFTVEVKPQDMEIIFP